MVTAEDNDRYQTCSRMLDEGKYEEALALAETISCDAFRASILVDAGLALRRSTKVWEGTELFEGLLSSEGPEQEFARHSLLYNAANGRSSLYQLKRMRRKTTVPTNDDDLRSAKKLYREALASLEDRSGPFASQLLVNYGNCLSQFGRYIEAIECYREALEADGANGMAAGNLGIELERVAWIMGRYRHEYMALAHDLLTRALSPEMHLKFGSAPAVQTFQSTLHRLQYFIDSHEEPILPPDPIEIREQDTVLKEYMEFCLDHSLFLNAWVGDKVLTPGATDDIVFGSIVTEREDDHLVPELLRILNEIKESFAVARYLFFLSQGDKGILNKISGVTLYYGIDSFEINGIYTGLCKTAYARAFDVLDKVARIVNVYFGIGNRRSPFWNLFAERQSVGEEHVIRFGARPAIQRTENYSLYALADLCIDYFESEHVDFSTIDERRNRITHDYLTVKLHTGKKEKKDNSLIELDELSEQAERVLCLAKYAILYVVSAVSIAEAKKNHGLDKALQIEIPDRPGKPFL